MRRRDDVYVEDILHYATRVVETLRDVSWEHFLENEVLQAATAHWLQIVGEAARGLSDGFRQAYADIPWHEIVVMRNVIVPNYGRVDAEIVWGAATTHLPMLAARLPKEIPGS